MAISFVPRICLREPRGSSAGGGVTGGIGSKAKFRWDQVWWRGGQGPLKGLYDAEIKKQVSRCRACGG